MSRLGTRGSSLVEAMTAVAVLAAASVAVASTVIAAQRSRASAGRWMRAALLAAGDLERLRAGPSPAAEPTADGFRSTGQATPVSGGTGWAPLTRLEVAVTWNDGSEHELRLATLVRR